MRGIILVQVVAALLLLCARGLHSLKAETSASSWHRRRRERILERYPRLLESVSKGGARTLPSLVLVNVFQVLLASHIGKHDWSTLETAAIGATIGGTASLWQFSLLHDIKHGLADLPKGVKGFRVNDVLFWGSQPSVFGYFLYLRYGHLSHHRDFGTKSLKDSFDSTALNFEDGDVLFSAHRQMLAGDNRTESIGFFGSENVGGRGLSISRSFYSLFWREDSAFSNLLVYSISMAYERAALCVNDKIVAMTGSNFFFPNKPEAFLETNVRYARAASLVHGLLFLSSGPQALLYLFFSELSWQLPIHPAIAMFISNHPSYTSIEENGQKICQPTSSVYGSAVFDWICAFSNYHTEHHDFPDVPMWNLKEVRDQAPEFYESLEGADDSLVTVIRKSFRGRQFYGCNGDISPEPT